MEVSIFTSRVYCKDSVDNGKELLNPLVKSQVLATLYQQAVILLVAAVNSDLPWSPDGAQNQADLLYAGYLNIFLTYGLLVEGRILILARDFNDVFSLMKLVAIQLI